MKIINAWVWRRNFRLARLVRVLRAARVQHFTILTRYTDSDIRHEPLALVLASLIYRSVVSRIPFISSFTVLRHDLRRIRMRNDGIARASLARPLSRLLPSFLPLATVSVAWVYLACNFLVDSRKMPGKDAPPKVAFDPALAEVAMSWLLRGLASSLLSFLPLTFLF